MFISKFSSLTFYDNTIYWSSFVYVKDSRSLKILLGSYTQSVVKIETVLTANLESVQFVQDVVNTEINDIKTLESSQTKERDTQTGETDKEAADYHEDDQDKINETEIGECTEIESWITENGVNVTKLFVEYHQRIKHFVKSEGLIPIETYVQELTALNHIQVLKPLQHSDMMRKVSTDKKKAEKVF